MGVEFTPDIPRLKTSETLFYWEGFSFLSRTRQYSEAGPQPIVLRELACYLDEHGIRHPDQRWEAIENIKFIDDLYLDLLARRAKRERARARKGKTRV